MRPRSLLAIPLLAILAIAAPPVSGTGNADVTEPFRSWLAERGLAGLVDGSMPVKVSGGLPVSERADRSIADDQRGTCRKEERITD